MENKKIDLQAAKAAAADAGKNAFNLFDKARKKVVSAIDQNNDGKFDLSDISNIKDQISDKMEQQRLENEKNSLQPIFAEDLENPEFTITKLIRIIDMDQKHQNSAVCQGSIGHITVLKDMKIINIYTGNASVFGIQLHPNMDSETYYVDPCDRDSYIALDEYFDYLKLERVAELQTIAQNLGAKHFKVAFCEQQKTFTSNKVDAKAGAKAEKKQGADAEVHHEGSVKRSSQIEISAEMDYNGHPPVEPKLKYFKNDPQIKSLVNGRLANDITHQKYTLALSNSSGIKVKDAAKIDAALNAMKIAGNTTISSEAQTEARRFFEYEIDF